MKTNPNARANKKENAKEGRRESEGMSGGEMMLMVVTFKDTNIDKMLKRIGSVGFEDLEEVDAFVADYKHTSCCHALVVYLVKHFFKKTKIGRSPARSTG